MTDLVIPANLTDDEYTNLKKEILNRITQLNQLKKTITVTVLDYLSSIQQSLTELLQNINRNIDTLLSYLKLNILQQDINFIRNLLVTRLSFQDFEEPSISPSIANFFNQKFYKEISLDEWGRTSFLSSHNGGFLCGAVSSNEKILITGCKDKSIKVWNLLKNSIDYVLLGHLHEIVAVALVNTSYAVSGDIEGCIAFWSLKKRKLKSLTKAHSYWVTKILVLEDQSKLISSDWSGEVLVWDLSERTRIETYNIGYNIISIDFLKKKNKFIIGSHSDIFIWNPGPRELELVSNENVAMSMCTALANSQDFFVFSSYNEICVFGIGNIPLNFKLLGHSDSITSLSISPDDSLIISASHDRTVKIWKTQSQTLEHTFQYDIFSCAVICSRNYVRILLSNSDIIALDIESFQEVSKVSRNSFNCNTESFSENKDLIGYGLGKAVIIWNLINENIEHIFNGHLGHVLCVAVSKKHRFAISGSTGSNSNLIIWQFHENPFPVLLVGHKSNVNCLSISSSGKLLASGGEDKKVRIWDLNKLRSEIKHNSHKHSICSISFSSDSKYVVSGDQCGHIYIWNLKNQSNLQLIKTRNFKITNILFNRNNTKIISINEKDQISIWKLRNSRLETELGPLEAFGKLIEYNLTTDILRRYK